MGEFQVCSGEGLLIVSGLGYTFENPHQQATILDEKRRHPRLFHHATVKLIHDSAETLMLVSRDFSESGIYLVGNPDALPPPGTVVALQVQGLAEEPATIRATVVRKDEKGIGLRFIEESSP